jgi:hypothetical protein
MIVYNCSTHVLTTKDLPNLESGEGGRVLVTGVKGRAPTKFYKASLTYMGGLMVSGALVICGRDARRKALAVADGIIQKTRNIFKELGLPDYTELNVEVTNYFVSIVSYNG